MVVLRFRLNSWLVVSRSDNCSIVHFFQWIANANIFSRLSIYKESLFTSQEYTKSLPRNNACLDYGCISKVKNQVTERKHFDIWVWSYRGVKINLKCSPWCHRICDACVEVNQWKVRFKFITKNTALQLIEARILLKFLTSTRKIIPTINNNVAWEDSRRPFQDITEPFRSKKTP